jgi:hypothetical protein
MKYLKVLSAHFSQTQCTQLEIIQSLWSDYGHISRCFVPALNATVIVKYVDLSNIPEHPRGWSGEASHQRKLSSYHNEQRFYQYYAAELNTAYRQCMVPNMYFSEPELATYNFPVTDKSEGKTDGFLFVLEDLDALGYSHRCMTLSRSEISVCVQWLAKFHSHFLTKKTPDLWPQGTYWHLATRQAEFTAMPESKLKTAALNIAEKLQSAQHQTLLHGDAKLANFCFSADRQQVSAVDFQYVGRGVGVVDVVYLLGSCFTGSELAQHADDILDEYYANLTKFAVHHEVIEEWRDLVPYAWADFERFLVGWSPGHKKLNAYSQAQTKKALKKL